MFLNDVSFNTVLRHSFPFPRHTAVYGHKNAHPFHDCRTPPETTLLTGYRYWPGLKINQHKSACTSLSCTELQSCQQPQGGQCAVAEAEREGTFALGSPPLCTLLHQTTWKSACEPATGVSGDFSHPPPHTNQNCQGKNKGNNIIITFLYSTEECKVTGQQRESCS